MDFVIFNMSHCKHKYVKYVWISCLSRYKLRHYIFLSLSLQISGNLYPHPPPSKKKRKEKENICLKYTCTCKLYHWAVGVSWSFKTSTLFLSKPTPSIFSIMAQGQFVNKFNEFVYICIYTHHRIFHHYHTSETPCPYLQSF